MNVHSVGKAKYVIVMEIFLRFALAAVFLVAAIPKIIDPQAFALAVFRYRLVPYGMINAIALLLPWVELVMAGALMLPKSQFEWRVASERVLLLLLMGFTAAMAVNIHRGVDVECGCFSLNPDVGRIGATAILRNLLLMAAAAWLLRRDITRFKA
jgi:hypothetical protein